MTRTLTRAVEYTFTRLQKRRHLAASKRVQIDTVKSVCLLLGPYRNLTTLTVSTLFLHPNCQVLNHAAKRIFGCEQIDFLADYSDARFDAFLRYAIYISESGKRGQHGGSITHSHAFDEKYAMRQLFTRNRDATLLKERIQSLVWKESLRTSNHLRECKVNLESIFRCNKRLRFLVPVRCPIDCALSNLKTGHARLFAGESRTSPVERIVDAIMAEFTWIESLRKRHPDRFFIFFEHEVDGQTFEQLAGFLELDQNPEWTETAVAAFKSEKRYTHSPELLAFYAATVQRYFSDNPSLAAKFMRFLDISKRRDITAITYQDRSAASPPL